MKQNSIKTENFETLDRISIFLIILSALFLISSFLLPYLITNLSVIPIDFSETGSVGDTIGGIMNPFISIAGIFITFLAFYMQFRANKLQRELFDMQLANEKHQFKDELTEQRNQFSRNLLENQFYEMIKLHKENVNDIFTQHWIYDKEGNLLENYFINGRKNFDFFIEEIGIAYYVAKRIFKNRITDYQFKHAYSAVFHGVHGKEDLKPTENDLVDKQYCEYINKLRLIKKWHKANYYRGLKNNGIKPFAYENDYDYKPKNDLNYELFNGYSNFLGHYYRQLFQTVKFIAYQEVLSYEEKRNYLRILRAQLTNEEQVMLFYNWFSGFGMQWECENNSFFVDYRMIHNIYNELIIADLDLNQVFGENYRKKMKKEKNRYEDPLFEFEEW